MRRQLLEVSNQDVTVIGKLTGVYYEDCNYQLLMAQLRQRIRVLSREQTPKYYIKFVYKYKTIFHRRFSSSLPSALRLHLETTS
jgi:hypothetical protein